MQTAVDLALGASSPKRLGDADIDGPALAKILAEWAEARGYDCSGFCVVSVVLLLIIH